MKKPFGQNLAILWDYMIVPYFECGMVIKELLLFVSNVYNQLCLLAVQLIADTAKT
jgi:hypothetical protein